MSRIENDIYISFSLFPFCLASVASLAYEVKRFREPYESRLSSYPISIHFSSPSPFLSISYVLFLKYLLTYFNHYRYRIHCFSAEEVGYSSDV